MYVEASDRPLCYYSSLKYGRPAGQQAAVIGRPAGQQAAVIGRLAGQQAVVIGRLAGQQAAVIGLSLPPWCWDCKHVPPYKDLNIKIKFQGSNSSFPSCKARLGQLGHLFSPLAGHLTRTASSFSVEVILF